MGIDGKRPTSLNEERGQSDTTLQSERGKTDDSLADHRKRTEFDTDMRVKNDRSVADETRTRNRKDTDATTDLGRSGRTKSKRNRTDNEISADDALSAQRDHDDAAVDSERSLMDAALVDERNRKDEEANKFFDRERKEADKNLLRERSHADFAALASTNLLTHEQSSHDATKAALTSRDEFLAIVSHDLRNPIGAILSYADLLLEGAPRSEDEAKGWAEVIKRNAKMSLRSINDILDMERFAEGKLHMNFVPRDMQAVIRETVESFLHIAAERKIVLTAVVSAENPLVSCDRDRIGQVLANLIGNALKFTPEGGAVTVSTLHIENEFRVLISDTGQGIPEEQKKRIFDRYTQLGNKDRQGLGLGLFISSMLVKAHHGQIGVVSTAGEGSTFCFTLPIVRSTNLSGSH